MMDLTLSMMKFALKTINVVLKVMDFAFKTMNVVSKVMNFSFKMSNFAQEGGVVRSCKRIRCDQFVFYKSMEAISVFPLVNVVCTCIEVIVMIYL